MVWLDIAAPKVATRTRMIAGRKISDVGSDALHDHEGQQGDHRHDEADQGDRVHGSALLSGGEGDDGRAAVRDRGDGAGRYSPRSIS